MNIRQLEMFKAVGELEGYTRAGEKLHVSHSAICRQIRLLEDELHNTLVARKKKRVTLTEHGRLLLKLVDPILGNLAAAARSVSQFPRDLGRLNIGTETTMLTIFFPPILKKLKRHYPTITLLIKTGQAEHTLEDLRAGRLDVAVSYLPLPFRGRELLIGLLYQEELVPVVSKQHPLAGRKSVQVQELRDFPLIVWPRDSNAGRVLDRFFQRVNISPLIQLELENDEAVERAIEGSRAIAFLPRQRAARDSIPFFRIDDQRIIRNVALVRLRSNHIPEHTKYFWELCCERAKSFGGNLAMSELIEENG